MCDRRDILRRFDETIAPLDSLIERNIETFKKGNVTVSVTDRDGRPLCGVSLRVKQKTHDFRYGANLFQLDESETDEKNRLYRERFRAAFNMATLPFYWKSVEPTTGTYRFDKGCERLYRRPAIDLCMEYCEEYGIEPRAHGLAYDGHFPDRLRGLSDAAVKDEMRRWFSAVSARYGDRIPTFEVTNEMLFWWRSVTGFYNSDEFMPFSYRLADEYFPNARLAINEYPDVVWGYRDYAGTCRGRYGQYYLIIDKLIREGCRIDLIGMQFHMFYPRADEAMRTSHIYDASYLYRVLDTYADFGRPLEITEMTVPAYSGDAEDEAIQAALIERLYRIFFSHPAMERVIYWNMVDGYAWTPDNSLGDMTKGENIYYGGLLRYDFSEKPAYTAIKRMFSETYRTNACAVTDDSGRIALRGFYGDYEITAVKGEKSVTVAAAIRKGGENAYSIIR